MLWRGLALAIGLGVSPAAAEPETETEPDTATVLDLLEANSASLTALQSALARAFPDPYLLRLSRRGRVPDDRLGWSLSVSEADGAPYLVGCEAFGPLGLAWLDEIGAADTYFPNALLVQALAEGAERRVMCLVGWDGPKADMAAERDRLVAWSQEHVGDLARPVDGVIWTGELAAKQPVADGRIWALFLHDEVAVQSRVLIAAVLMDIGSVRD